MPVQSRPYPSAVIQDLLVPYDPSWPERFSVLRASIIDAVGDAILGVDHIGSTSVPGLTSKNVIDVQVTVEALEVVDRWPSEIASFTRRGNVTDHVPPGSGEGSDWEKRFWSSRQPRAHLHVRVAGRANHRYALLFRDYLRTHQHAADAYARVKSGLARICVDKAEYADTKDPVCDLIIQAAERWAEQTHWTPQINSTSPSDS